MAHRPWPWPGSPPAPPAARPVGRPRRSRDRGYPGPGPPAGGHGAGGPGAARAGDRAGRLCHRAGRAAGTGRRLPPAPGHPLRGGAPHPRQRRGHRSIWGGHAAVRAVRYMAALAATRSNPALRAFNRWLRAAGKAAHGGADRRPAQVAGPLQCPVHAPDLLGPDHGLALGARTQLRSLPNSLVLREFGPVTPGQRRQRVHKSRAIGDSGRLGLGSGSRGSSEVCCSRPARAAEAGRPAARHTISAGAGPLTGEVGKRVPGRGWRRFGGWPGGSGRC